MLCFLDNICSAHFEVSSNVSAHPVVVPCKILLSVLKILLSINFSKALKTFISDRVISSSPASDFLCEGLMTCKIFGKLDSDKGEK